jgi:hypothetical protein
MSEINFHKTTTLSPEQFVAGLTEFGPDHEKVFSTDSNVWAVRPGTPTTPHGKPTG